MATRYFGFLFSIIMIIIAFALEEGRDMGAGYILRGKEEQMQRSHYYQSMGYLFILIRVLLLAG